MYTTNTNIKSQHRSYPFFAKYKKHTLFQRLLFFSTNNFSASKNQLVLKIIKSLKMTIQHFHHFISLETFDIAVGVILQIRGEWGVLREKALDTIKTENILSC